MFYKRCGHCGKQIPINSVCECMKRREKEHNEKYKKEHPEAYKEAWKRYNEYKRDKERQAFYESPTWKRIRDYVLSKAAGMDELEWSDGHIVPANTVHHIVPVGVDFARAYDTTNLIAVSRKTHKVIHEIYNVSDAEMGKMQEKLFAIVRQREGIPPV